MIDWSNLSSLVTSYILYLAEEWEGRVGGKSGIGEWNWIVELDSRIGE